ncbi:hypothetical protein AB4144_41765, partial [Rhizobiaceae sp. 2RAB30]
SKAAGLKVVLGGVPMDQPDNAVIRADIARHWASAATLVAVLKGGWQSTCLCRGCARSALSDMDIYGPTKRSRVMSAVKSANTAPETAVRRLLHSMGYRYRRHAADLPGKPDIVVSGVPSAH